MNKLVKVSLAILMILAPFASISGANATTVIYTCPGGGVLSGNTCVVTTTSVATMAYTCPQGGTLSGNTCIRLITLGGNYLTSVIYYCPSGGVLSGNT